MSHHTIYDRHRVHIATCHVMPVVYVYQRDIRLIIRYRNATSLPLNTCLISGYSDYTEILRLHELQQGRIVICLYIKKSMLCTRHPLTLTRFLHISFVIHQNIRIHLYAFVDQDFLQENCLVSSFFSCVC